MAVVPKPRKNSTTYYVATWYLGKAYWERSGTDKREAERLDQRRKREVEAGTFQPHVIVKRSRVSEYAKQWGDARETVTAQDERTHLRRFTELPDFGGLHIDDVRARHVIAALGKLKGTVSRKTLSNAFGVLRTMFRDAVIADLIAANPCVLPRDFFGDDEAEAREPYERHEAALLVRHDSIQWPVRVLNALCILGGLREGEACGRRWRDLDQKPGPLWALDVKTQYDGKPLKTRRPRVVPVHPELAELLEEWGRVGFVELMGRAPNPDDFIVPHVAKRGRRGYWTKSTYSKAFVAGCTGAGVRYRTLHATRHTMITLARRAGCNAEHLERVTHNAKGTMLDRYTHLDWEPLCEAVLAIGSLFGDFGARRSPRRFGTFPRDLGHADTRIGVPMLAESHDTAKRTRSTSPAPREEREPKTRATSNRRQSGSQSQRGGSVGIGGHSRAAHGPVGSDPPPPPAGANGPSEAAA
jgi:integrase